MFKIFTDILMKKKFTNLRFYHLYPFVEHKWSPYNTNLIIDLFILSFSREKLKIFWGISYLGKCSPRKYDWYLKERLRYNLWMKLVWDLIWKHWRNCCIIFWWIFPEFVLKSDNRNKSNFLSETVPFFVVTEEWYLFPLKPTI